MRCHEKLDNDEERLFLIILSNVNSDDVNSIQSSLFYFTTNVVIAVYRHDSIGRSVVGTPSYMAPEIIMSASSSFETKLLHATCLLTDHVLRRRSPYSHEVCSECMLNFNIRI